jgi:hypothetical protein
MMVLWRSLTKWLRGTSFSALGPRKLLLDALVALSMAFLVWLYTRARVQSSLDDVQIPVQIALAPGTAGNYELEVQGTNRIPVSFTGPVSRIRELRQQIQRGLIHVTATLAVPEEQQKESTFRDSILVEARDVPVPAGVVPVLIEGHNTIAVTLHRLVERQLPVRLDYSGELRISNVKVEPASVLVRGPREVLDRARFISTKPYTVPLAEEEVSGDGQIRSDVALVTEMDGRQIQCTPAGVGLRLRAHPRQQVYDLQDVPVQFLCPPGLPWRPHFTSASVGKVSLRVVGPAGDELPKATAYIDLTSANLARGRNVEPLRVQLPREYQLLQDQPQMIAFELDPD